MPDSPEPRPLLVNLFEMATPGHVVHGAWRLDGSARARSASLPFWLELAETAEAAGFGAVFLADVLGAYDLYRGGPESAIREGMQIPNLDPMLVVPAMAAVTSRLGFGVTFSTSYEPPFAFARRMSTLDHLTAGRVGWNVVTSYLPNAARNFGLDAEIPHDERFRIADEFMDVVYKLWEGSWDDDAVLVDREAGVFSEPSKVRPINHIGEHFRVAGPHLVAPSPQRTPVIFQASASRAGIEFAAKHSEVLFTADRPPGSLRRNIPAVRSALVDAGRRADDTRFLVMATIITGRTDAEVSAKLERYRRFRSEEGALIHTSVPFHPLAHPQHLTVREAVLAEGRPELLEAGLPLELSIAEYRRGLDAAWDDRRFFVAATPSVVVDELERWIDEDGIDGINLRQFHSFETARDFGELIVPELRRRGRLREPGQAGQTLRDRIFGDGPLLPERHPAARYRGGRNLG